MVLLRLRHWLVLLLFLLLPFHALFVTVGTKMIAGPGHAPLPLLAVWKEVIIAALFIIGIAELYPRLRKRLAMSGGWRAIVCNIDVIKGCVLALLFIAFALQFTNGQLSIINYQFIYGFKYLFVPLIFFLLMQSLEWKKDFVENTLLPLLLCLGGILAAYGIATYFLPMQYFVQLGYSDAHSLYAPGSPLSAFQHISGTAIRRVQGAFAGPNQFGLWLLLPWSVGTALVLKHREQTWWLPVFLVQIALVLTFSRAAWIAAFCIAVVSACVLLSHQSRNIAVTGLLASATVGCVIVLFLFPDVLFRAISNEHHLSRVQDAVVAIIQRPLGHGLGSAGPASNRLSDACLYFAEEADLSWARDRSDLCLFRAGQQVRPSLMEKTCHCPVLPENWYLQVGYELGVVGFVLFIVLVGKLLVTGYRLPVRGDFSGVVFLAFLGVSIAALFLHAWEDSAVAYTVWGVMGIMLASKRVEENKVA
jgi:hypothetical protein